ncbi:CLUMA_CG021488, isoform A [Clunio marinus]|uniref:CLUMA_CG021488, isoform A n=1 Tax=Clunio marinus TaxID=568069 RepID=A0A1J1J7E0_9DIPT|nr:CLUMA_CG021488, isoform A [Clunio marinus]
MRGNVYFPKDTKRTDKQFCLMNNIAQISTLKSLLKREFRFLMQIYCYNAMVAAATVELVASHLIFTFNSMGNRKVLHKVHKLFKTLNFIVELLTVGAK